MIDNIFWDIDETLIHSYYKNENNAKAYNQTPTFEFSLADGSYCTFIRDNADEVVEYSRSVVGKDNVFILTRATHDYALEINKNTGWDFSEKNIIARENIYLHNRIMRGFRSGWHLDADHNLTEIELDSSKTSKFIENLKNFENILIDDLAYPFNEEKYSLLGIEREQYLKIEGFYGININSVNQNFEKMVKEFIDNHTK
jgi:hypothetical protein